MRRHKPSLPGSQEAPGLDEAFQILGLLLQKPDCWRSSAEGNCPWKPSSSNFERAGSERLLRNVFTALPISPARSIVAGLTFFLRGF